MSTPVLDTILELLEFKNGCTIAEIASTAGLKKIDVLKIVNRNGQYVKRNRKTGKITGIDLKRPLQDQLWQSGRFYRVDSYGAWCHEGYQITLEGHPDLRERLLRGHVTGGLGDSWEIKIIEATPENIAAVEAEGIRPWSEAVIDHRLWSESE